LWAADSLLAGKIGKVTAEKSERMRVGDDDVLIWRFSGTLRGDN
jgi:hypothetical protein